MVSNWSPVGKFFSRVVIAAYHVSLDVAALQKHGLHLLEETKAVGSLEIEEHELRLEQVDVNVSHETLLMQAAPRRWRTP